jgi:hypothetical protein
LTDTTFGKTTAPTTTTTRISIPLLFLFKPRQKGRHSAHFYAQHSSYLQHPSCSTFDPTMSTEDYDGGSSCWIACIHHKHPSETVCKDNTNLQSSETTLAATSTRMTTRTSMPTLPPLLLRPRRARPMARPTRRSRGSTTMRTRTSRWRRQEWR